MPGQIQYLINLTKNSISLLGRETSKSCRPSNLLSSATRLRGHQRQKRKSPNGLALTEY